MDLPTGEEIAELQSKTIAAWYEKDAAENAETDDFLRLVVEQTKQNYLLWNEEDKARRTDVDDRFIAEVKRAIDGLNQKRNDLIEKLDEKLFESIGAKMREDAPLNSETPGSIIDRLSIGALKSYHMEIESKRAGAGEEHCRKAAAKLAVLREQRKDLAGCLTGLVGDVTAGRRRFRIYRQYKMYNDPSLNPELYKKKS